MKLTILGSGTAAPILNRNNSGYVLEVDKNNLWVGSENVAYNILFDNAGYPVNIMPYTFKTDFTERILVRSVFNVPFFFLSTGLYSAGTFPSGPKSGLRWVTN